MKTIEYPIKELVSFRMDENKIWWLKYNFSISHLLNKKQGREYDYQIDKFCEEDNNFSIKPESYYLEYLFPMLLFPKVILRNFSSENWKDHVKEMGFRKIYPNQGIPSPYYGNPHYKKYIEDNNGECPLPLPEDMKWWEV